ncbi:MAG: hypothetical protein ACJASM_003238 [Salibacteraceae bacterium]
MLNATEIQLENVVDTLKLILSDPHDNPAYPEKREQTFKYLGEFYVSKYVISVLDDRGTKFDSYSQL